MPTRSIIRPLCIDISTDYIYARYLEVLPSVISDFRSFHSRGKKENFHFEFYEKKERIA